MRSSSTVTALPAQRFKPFWLLSLLGVLIAAMALLAPQRAHAQQQQVDLPGRVARLAHQDGTAVVALDGRGTWSPAVLNLPLTTGARLAGEPGSRTELHTGTAALRLTGRSDLAIAELDDDTTRLALTEGTLSARVRQLYPNERFEINTPNLAVIVQQPGELRLDVDPRSDTTRATAYSGTFTLYGDRGQAVPLHAGQQMVLGGRDLAVVSQGYAGGRDGFDQWVASRDAQEDRAQSAQYVSRDIPGYQQLDQYGQWSQDPTYGAIWYPTVTVADWAPYRYGQWRWIDPWGWTWVDDAPWGFAPMHYGRWTQIGPRWAWVPGPMNTRPAYSPALVGFVGGTAGSGNWGLSLGSGPGVAWFPLAPGEFWEPGYYASSRYRQRINPWANTRERVNPPANSFYFQRRPNAVSFAPHDQFVGHGSGRPPRYLDGNRLPQGQLSDGRIVAPPPRAYIPGVAATGTPNAVLLPRPDAHGMSDPRRARNGSDRGWTPAPAGDVRPGRYGPGYAAPAPEDRVGSGGQLRNPVDAQGRRVDDRGRLTQPPVAPMAPVTPVPPPAAAQVQPPVRYGPGYSGRAPEDRVFGGDAGNAAAARERDQRERDRMLRDQQAQQQRAAQVQQQQAQDAQLRQMQAQREQQRLVEQQRAADQQRQMADQQRQQQWQRQQMERQPMAPAAPPAQRPGWQQQPSYQPPPQREAPRPQMRDDERRQRSMQQFESQMRRRAGDL